MFRKQKTRPYNTLILTPSRYPLATDSSLYSPSYPAAVLVTTTPPPPKTPPKNPHNPPQKKNTHTHPYTQKNPPKKKKHTKETQVDH